LTESGPVSDRHALLCSLLVRPWCGWRLDMAEAMAILIVLPGATAARIEFAGRGVRGTGSPSFPKGLVVDMPAEEK